MRILIVEDDDSVAQVLKILLSEHNYAVDVAFDGESGLDLAEAYEYDLILLDVILPKMDGVTLCQQLRTKGHSMPILLLTGRDDSHEKAIALNTGADDYVVKPFDQEELIARIQALLRRSGAQFQPILEWGELRLDPSSRDVTYDSHVLSLTPKEHAILELFLRHNQRVLSPGAILDHAWNSEETPGEEAVRVHIKGLRHKLKAAGAAANFIETVYGVGYRLNPDQGLIEPVEKGQTNSPEISGTKKTARTDVGAQSNASSGSDRSQRWVMIFTQDEGLFAFLKALLEPRNLQVDVLRDSENFWQTMEIHPPNLLILDLNSFEEPEAKPGLKSGFEFGVELCQQIRRDARWQTLPIICLIPNKDPDLVKQVFAVGASDFVSQPIVGPEFVARIVHCLE